MELMIEIPGETAAVVIRPVAKAADDARREQAGAREYDSWKADVAEYDSWSSLSGTRDQDG